MYLPCPGVPAGPRRPASSVPFEPSSAKCRIDRPVRARTVFGRPKTCRLPARDCAIDGEHAQPLCRVSGLGSTEGRAASGIEPDWERGPKGQEIREQVARYELLFYTSFCGFTIAEMAFCAFFLQCSTESCRISAESGCGGTTGMHINIPIVTSPDLLV